jgi:hypothetical protein
MKKIVIIESTFDPISSRAAWISEVTHDARKFVEFISCLLEHTISLD